MNPRPLILVVLLFSTLFIGCKKKKKEVFKKQSPLFTSLTSGQTGIDFINHIPESSFMNSMVYEYFYNGGGVAIGDVDNDGLPDIYFTGNLKGNKLYKNLGDFKFQDITKSARVGSTYGWTTGVSMVDINADGWLDIYVCKSGMGNEKIRKNLLYINNGNGTFSEKASEYGLNFSGFSTQASFFDYDKDGDLDLFLLNHNIKRINTNNPEEFKNDSFEFSGDKFFRNDGGMFIDVSKEAGIIGNSIGFGLGVSIGDLNQDGWPDIYVANDYIEQDYLYLNNTDGTFTEHMKSMLGHTSYFSMGTDIADFNNDGLLDIITLDMVAEDNFGIKTSMSGMNPKKFNHAVEHGFHYQYMFNTLQLNNGNGNFSDIAQLAGISNTDWSWAPLFADFDNDGLKDLFVSNGLKRDFRNNDFIKYKRKRLEQAQKNKERMSTVVEELVNKTPQKKTLNYFFKNNGNLTYKKVTKAWGVNEPTFSNGVAYGDLDNDGDLDLVVNNIDEEATILQNNNEQNYIQFTFKGATKNKFGIGARVIIKTDKGSQLTENYVTRGYQSSVSPLIHFGLSEVERIKMAKILWPDGKSQVLKDIACNQRLTIDYKNAKFYPAKTKPSKRKYFTDVTKELALAHKHIENEFDDFERESLLPHKMSEFGPALTVADVNNDGLDDFYVGGALGYAGSLYLQSNDGTFLTETSGAIWQKDKKHEDIDAAFFDADNDGDMDLYVVSGGNEHEVNGPLLQDRLYINNGQGTFAHSKKALPTMRASGGVVKPGDYNNDGKIDLFVGGRQVPGKYPFPATSYLLENKGGVFVKVGEEQISGLEQMGMVTDAVWTDYNQDDLVDLVIVGEWMPIQIYKNNGDNSFEKVENTTLQENVGWWFTIAAADFDNDGDQDFIAGNLGANYKYKATKEEPFTIHAKDFDENGSIDIVLGYHNQGDLYPLRGRECSSNQMPFIKEKFPDYDSFGKANLMDVYGTESLKDALQYSVTNFYSVYIENTGDDFIFHRLPNEAQFSSINAIQIDDFDHDGLKDVLVAGNLYQSEVETPRNDAGIGLLLKGKGDSTFGPVPYIKSGVLLNTDVKKMHSIGLVNDQKGILVASNNDSLRLITN